MVSDASYKPKNVAKKVFAIIVIGVVATNHVQLTDATIVVISKASNETVFSAEETGIDAASAYDLKGNLAIADPIDACTEVKPPPTRNRTIFLGAISGQQQRESWILWASYNYTSDFCSLSRKAKEAERAGYSAIIITVYGKNDTDGILPSFMGFDWMGIRIYTSILGENMGSALKKYAYPSPYYVKFENEPYFQLGLLVNFVFLGSLGIVIVVLMIKLSHWLYIRVSTIVVERRRKRKAYLTESQLKKLPVLHWRTAIPQDTCSICIDNFEVGEEIRVLPCSHVFHKPCIDPWLIHSSRRCPNCKGKVVFPNEHLSDTSNSDSDSQIVDSDDEYAGTERTPLLRSNDVDSDDQMEDTRFVEALTESHNTRTIDATSSRSNSLSLESGRVSTTESACLIDITPDGDTEQISDDSFGSFQSAKGNETMLVDVDCSQSLRSVKSFDSDRTYTDEGSNSGKATGSKNISMKNDEFTSSISSNTSFFSCHESELEKSTVSNSNHELFQSFSS
ncbi:E3 ubiquitin-protein ligase RNF13 [Orchesella cincta]|uniref:E3 ubiquitin-protein ligase RNF13 n=1 Tax=Orchesella cincta TaxID=48709 RepID=A0A1D2NEI0_ORCCI|nr:E3 ubiquitin-protein ligase RNF13 [Orchesella cincta]